jgi:hypothetical protein
MLNTTALSVLVQLTNVVVVWLVGQGLGAEAPAAYYLTFVPVVALMTMLPVSVSGMGVREGLTVLLLAPVGVPEGTAFSLAFLWFLVQAATSLGGIVFYIGGRMAPPAVDSPVEGAEHGPVGNHPGQGREGQPESAPRAPHRLPASAESPVRVGPRR